MLPGPHAADGVDEEEEEEEEEEGDKSAGVLESTASDDHNTADADDARAVGSDVGASDAGAVGTDAVAHYAADCFGAYVVVHPTASSSSSSSWARACPPTTPVARPTPPMSAPEPKKMPKRPEQS